jgi:hypothetical protein
LCISDLFHILLSLHTHTHTHTHTYVHISTECMYECMYVALNPISVSDHPILEHPQPVFFPKCRDRVSYPYKTQNIMQFRSSGLLCHVDRCRFNFRRVKRSFVLRSTSPSTPLRGPQLHYRPVAGPGRSSAQQQAVLAKLASILYPSHLLCGTLTVYP